jgi:hypothetical protein
MINITLMSAGMTMAFEDGAQVGVAQIPWLQLYLHWLAMNGIDPCEVSIMLPNGSQPKIIKTDLGWNW